MPTNLSIRANDYVKQLKRAIRHAKPYFKEAPSGQASRLPQRNSFPDKPGVYLILRKVTIAGKDSRYRKLHRASPMVLYVGRTKSRRTIAERLVDSFGKLKLNFGGSQFLKVLMQVIQDEAVVKTILWSPQTLVAAVPITEGDQMLNMVKQLATQFFHPRLNVRDS